MSMLSSTCSLISRAVNPPVAWIKRSASVDFPWSMWAIIEKLRISERSVIARALSGGRGGCHADLRSGGAVDVGEIDLHELGPALGPLVANLRQVRAWRQRG